MVGLPVAGVLAPDNEYCRNILAQVVRSLPGVGRTPHPAEQASCGPGLLWSGPPTVGGPPGWIKRSDGGAVIFHGRLDNRDELITALGAEPESSSGELARLAWERWGDMAPARMIGGYVLIAWDGRREELFLAVDHTGQETLFYVADDGRFLFAGNPLGLLAAPGVSGKADEEHFAHWVMGRRFLHDRTMYDGVRRIAPGHLARVGRGGMRTQPFWTPGRRETLRLRRDEDYVAAAREMLDRVVAPHVPANGDVVAELSGGLDSTAVVATAARLAPSCRIATFTTVSEPGAPQAAGPAHTAVDDWPNAAAVAALYPNVTPRRVEAGGLASGEIDPTGVFMAFGCPIGETSHSGWVAPRTAALKAYVPSVLLTGEGGNFTLSDAGLGLLSDLAASGRWIALAREVLATAKSQGWTASSTLLNLAVLPNIPPAWRRRLRRLRGKTARPWADRAPLRPEAVDRFGLEKILKDVGKLRPMELTGDAIGQLLDQMDRFIGKNFRRTWHYRQLCLDARNPLFDVRMIDFTLALPRDQFLRRGDTRWLARRTLEDRLPHAVAWDNRHYLHCPEWLHRLTRSKPYWLPELDRLEDCPTARDLLDLPRMRELAARWPDAPDRRHEGAFREIVARGVVAGQFLRWMQRDNA